MDISISVPYKIPEDISTRKLPSYFPKNFKMQYNDIGSVQVVWKYPSDDLMAILGELKWLQVRGKPQNPRDFALWDMTLLVPNNGNKSEK